MLRSTKLFRIFGIDVQLHYSWWLVFAFLAWSLSTTFFPHYFPDQNTVTYWVMGVVAVLLLFVSVLLHELSHSLVAKAKNINVESITLFFFGGVASIDDEDLKPGSEFLMSIAGPLFSLLLFGLFYVIYLFNGNLFWTAITFYLYQLNLILALFNLVPGYPLDGGRAFRAILHAYYKDIKKATQIAVWGGKSFALLLMLLGFASMVSNSGNGLWFVFLGAFLYFIAGKSYEQVLVKEALGKILLRRVLEKNYVSLDPSLCFSDFLKRYRSSEQEFFVVKDKGMVGILDLRKISSIPEKTKKQFTVKQAAVSSELVGLGKNDTAYTAFRKFSEQEVDILPVMDKGKLLGLVSKRKVMHQLLWSLKFGFVEEKKDRMKK